MNDHLEDACLTFKEWGTNYSIVTMPCNDHKDGLHVEGSFQCYFEPTNDFMGKAYEAIHVYIMSATSTHIRGFIVDKKNNLTKEKKDDIDEICQALINKASQRIPMSDTFICIHCYTTHEEDEHAHHREECPVHKAKNFKI